jgi:Fe-S cluster assembly protein SufB
VHNWSKDVYNLNTKRALIVNGFIEPVAKELPMEYAVELNRLIQIEVSGDVG